MSNLGVLANKLSRPWIRVGVATLVICIMAFLVVSAGPLFSEPSGTLILDPESEDFGTVWAQPNFKWRLTIHNPGTRDVVVKKLSSSCICTRVTNDSFVVPAKSSIEVSLDIDLTRRSKTDFDATRSFDTSLVPVIAQATSGTHKTWTIRGKVRNFWKFSEPTVDFADRLIKGMPFPNRSVKLVSREPLGQLNIETDPRICNAEILRDSDEPTSFELRINPLQSLDIGSFKTSIILKPVLENGMAGPTADVTIIGDVVHLVRATPEEIGFGAISCNSSAHETITFSARVPHQFTVRPISPADPELGVTQSDDDSRQKLSQFTVKLTPGTPAARRRSLAFAVTPVDSNDSNDSYTLTVPVHWLALPTMQNASP